MLWEPTLTSFHSAACACPARKAAFPGYHIIRTPAPDAGIEPPLLSAPPATNPPSGRRLKTGGMTTGLGSGRGLPPVPAPAVNVKVPARPFASRHVPLSVASAIEADTGMGVPPGAATMVRPRPTVPSGLRKAVPMADAGTAPPPHWSSVPSSR